MDEGRKTLTRWTIEKEHENNQQDTTGDFSGLLNAVATGAKIIANQVNKGALVGALGSASAGDHHGKVQRNLDVISNEVMISQTEWTGHLAAIASEDMEDVYAIPERYQRGKYLLVFDPLDGSGNIDVNISVGTIFSILRSPSPGAGASIETFLQAGVQQI
ncbi:MAG: class 1 fructose-bisphosphatase, partial [Actinomycetota bacterium]|nr:class 1 fructose-bisphosphatase [Actinomycetota bacterium]